VRCVLQAGGAVTSLDISDNNLSAGSHPAQLAAKLAQLTALKALTMNQCALATWPLGGLGPRSLPMLQTLELCGNSFGRCCPADGLAACPRLKSLDLSGVVDPIEHVWARVVVNGSCEEMPRQETKLQPVT
jgi:hypothetical protein